MFETLTLALYAVADADVALFADEGSPADVAVACKLTVPLVPAVTVAGTPIVSAPPFGKVGIVKLLLSALGQTAPPLAVQVNAPAVKPAPGVIAKATSRAVSGPALLTTTPKFATPPPATAPDGALELTLTSAL